MEEALPGSSGSGQVLAELLRGYAGREDVVVLALPRGGVPVAYEVARALDAPLDVFLVRKLGVPGHEELAMGAIATGGVRVLERGVVAGAADPRAVIEAVAAEQRELERREREYRDDRARRRECRGKTVILVDDGLATGSTMRAAAAALRQLRARAGRRRGAGRCARDVRGASANDVDEVVCADHARAVLRRRPLVRGLLPDDRRRGPRAPGRAGERQRRAA